ncbi:MAG TPA: hypothetical protein VFE63_20420 [Roseiarcus sp.]|jgi:hypothetical protein|nr:hypothetical protein [Roseiarcus sp.]
MIRLVEFWRSCDFDQPPYVHGDDLLYIDDATNMGDVAVVLRNHREFVEHRTFGEEKDTLLHLGLLPFPIQGNLFQADIFILMLNPGLGLCDYQTQEDAGHAEQVRLIIKQEFANVEYPFLSLNPDYAWTGGFQWWEKKLREVIKRVAIDYCEGNYAASLRLLSQRLAAIEIFPYHSRKFKANSLISRLPSALEAKEFVQSLLPRAQRGEITIVVSRGIDFLGIGDHDFVNYNHKLRRAAPLGLKTPGGSAIIEALKQRPPH